MFVSSSKSLGLMAIAVSQSSFRRERVLNGNRSGLIMDPDLGFLDIGLEDLFDSIVDT